MGVSIGFGLGPLRVSAPLSGGPTHGYRTQWSPHRPGQLRVWQLVLILLAAMFTGSLMFAVYGPLMVVPLLIGLAVGIWGTRYPRRYQGMSTAARAEFQHAAIMRGEIGLGTYGSYQPARTHDEPRS